MPPLLWQVAAAAVLSTASFIVVLLRVSPLSAPGVALPFFFLTFFLALSSSASLVFFAMWRFTPVEGMDIGRKITNALREGIFLAVATVILIVFLMLGILTWWVGVLIYAVFVFVELALLV